MNDWKSSIALRLSLAFALLAGAVFTALGIYLSQSADAHMAELDAHELLGKLAFVRHVGTQETMSAGFSSRVTEALSMEHGVMVAVDGNQGTTLHMPEDGPLNELWLATADSKEFPVRVDLPHQSYRVVTARIQTAWGENLRILVARDIRHHTDFLDHLQRDFWLAVLAAAILTVLIGMFITRQGMLRIRAIALAAGRISAGDLTERIPEHDVPRELAELVQAFNATLGRLENSFQRLNDFSADLAHELRTPIHSLRMQTEVSLTQSRSTDEYRDLLASNLEEYDRLSRMIADMLFLAKAEHGLVIPEQGTVNLLALGQRLLDFYGILANEQTISLSGEALTVQGDPLMLERAIGNLLANAIHHTPAHGQVDLQIQAQPSFALITVSNTGAIIPPSVKDRIFERFVRLNEQGYEGNGLGLAITKSIVLAHHGQITVESSEAITCFSILLPRC
jgi:two-component system, OmpR family, heavy metal sensor histidine kinase CusS